jgi:hypothetical protein
VGAQLRQVVFGLPGSRPSMGRCRAARAGRNEVQAGERAYSESRTDANAPGPWSGHYRAAAAMNLSEESSVS